ncbi:MAG: cobyric acid synthase [Bacteroidaceae bacterium]|nr:cobyric acid synthase [Bacteroidaceae bacterium]
MKNEKLHPLMLCGTGSDVGKSVLATALCRIFVQDGYQPAPFKAQNMALNSYATPDGFEIGRAQAVQAEACRLQPHTDMNPLLLKPNSEHTTQVVLNGKPIGNRSAYEYFRKEGREELRVAVNQAFDRLESKYNPIVMEGAGSVSEINLRHSDLVNLPMARHAKADVILVADIDRGGVFASCYGSIMLQTPEDRSLIKGIIINKFRGDIRLFEEGRRMMEEICGVPVLGVVPMFKDIAIEEEDSVALGAKNKAPQCSGKGGSEKHDGRNASEHEDARQAQGQATPSTERGGNLQIAVVLLRHISNFTDFNTLERDPRINLFYTNNPKDIESADIIIVPGTKATLDDLYELRRNGVAQSIIRAHKAGKTVVGICGGYQILGQMVYDPDGVEGTIAQLPGLGLLNVETTMNADKTTQQVSFDFEGNTCRGYEIHQGVTMAIAKDGERAKEPLPKVLIEGHCMGTYVHGILDNAPVIDYLLRPFADRTAGEEATETYEDFKERQYDLLANHVRQYVDIEKIYEIIRGGND